MKRDSLLGKAVQSMFVTGSVIAVDGMYGNKACEGGFKRKYSASPQASVFHCSPIWTHATSYFL